MRRDVLVAVAVFALALWQNLAQVPDTSFNPDESRWLHRAHYLRDVIHPFGPTWKPGYLTRGQPPLGSYATGIGLLAQGRDLATNGSWIYTCQEGVCRTGFQERAENVAAGNVPSAADLQAGRRTSAVVGALTALVVYLLGARLTNRTGGWPVRSFWLFTRSSPTSPAWRPPTRCSASCWRWPGWPSRDWLPGQPGGEPCWLACCSGWGVRRS